MQTETYLPESQIAWREWLQEHHHSNQGIWLIYYKKKVNPSALTWTAAVDEALCFGWVDSRRRPIDNQSFMQFFCQRKPKSGWSKINKEKVRRLIKSKQMTKAGMKSINTAKQNGSWTALDKVEKLIIPPDLEDAFLLEIGSKKHFLSLSKTIRKSYLQWIMFAKQHKTRTKRIGRTVKLYKSM